ncbi:MAG TPA: PilZ domain-containing protein [Terriglobales bacterium]|nr:PilZ domain-containing protein [Terriglobales bacterium]
MALTSAVSVLKKAAARAVLFNVDEMTAAILRDCFKQFGIDTTVLTTADAARLQKEKVDACVIWLDEDAGQILEQARTSPSNRRLVVFGICGGVGEAIRYSKYGINVLLEKPVDRQNALRAVRATHLLIINEFRRYVRIPIVVKLEAVAGLQHISGSTIEVSGGGMSIRYKGKLAMGDDIQVAFDLPGQAGLKLKGQICWLRPTDSMAGVKFEIDQPARESVKRWIDQYLDID